MIFTDSHLKVGQEAQSHWRRVRHIFAPYKKANPTTPSPLRSVDVAFGALYRDSKPASGSSWLRP